MIQSEWIGCSQKSEIEPEKIGSEGRVKQRAHVGGRCCAKISLIKGRVLSKDRDRVRSVRT
jgi:hypothetical protein